MSNEESSSLEQLDRLLDEGRITEEEYHELRAAMRPKPVQPPELPRQEEQPRKRLCKNYDERMLGGVCAGFADYFGIDALIIRIIALVLLVTTWPIFLLGYVVVYFLMPWKGGRRDAYRIGGALRLLLALIAAPIAVVLALLIARATGFHLTLLGILAIAGPVFFGIMLTLEALAKLLGRDRHEHPVKN